MAQEKVNANLTAHAVAKLKASKDNEDGRYNSLSDTGESASILYDFGDTVDQAVEFFGEKVVQSMIKGHILFTLQGKMRTMLSQGKSDEDIQDALYDTYEDKHIWKPGLAPQKKSRVEKMRDKGMTDDQIRAQIEAELALLED